jgi:hypothetical protein
MILTREGTEIGLQTRSTLYEVRSWQLAVRSESNELRTVNCEL